MNWRFTVLLSLVTAVITVLATVTPVGAAQYDPPFADTFGFAYAPDPQNLNTEESAERFSYYMGLAGYSSFKDLNKTVRTGMGPSYAQSDAVWAFFGHGSLANGGVLFCDTNGRPCDTATSTWLWTNSTVAVGRNSSCSSPNQCLSGVTGLGDIRLMLFAACFTGRDAAPGTYLNGNLVDYAAVNRGVDNAFGFTGEVAWPMGHDYATFAGRRMWDGEPIIDALYWAGVDVRNRWFGNAYGWNTLYGQGYANDRITPAAYGSHN